MTGTVDAFTLAIHVRKEVYQDVPRHAPAVPSARVHMAGEHDIRRVTSSSFPVYEDVHNNGTVSRVDVELHRGGELHHSGCTAVDEKRDPLQCLKVWCH